MRKLLLAALAITALSASTAFAQTPPVDLPVPAAATTNFSAKETGSFGIQSEWGNERFYYEGEQWFVYLTGDGRRAVCESHPRRENDGGILADGETVWCGSSVYSTASGKCLCFLPNLRALSLAEDGSGVFLYQYGGYNYYDSDSGRHSYRKHKFTQTDKASGKTKEIELNKPTLLSVEMDTGYVTKTAPVKTSIDYSANNKKASLGGSMLAVVSGSQDDRRNEIHVLSTDSCSEVSVWRDVEGFTDCCVSPDGALVAACSPDHLVKIWDVKTNKVVSSMDAHETADVVQVLFSPDGKRLASTDKQGKLIIWNVATWKPEITIAANAANGAFVNHVTFTPDGKLLAMAQENTDSVTIWNAQSGEKVGVIPCSDKANESVKSVGFSKDTKTMAAIARGRYGSDSTLGYKLYVWKISY